MTSAPTPVTSEPSAAEPRYDAPRALRLVPELPDGRSRRAFGRDLERRGLSRESATAVARAVVKPDVARALLENPTTYRVPGAELLVIRVEVYTTRVIADATNPRILNTIPFPAAVPPGQQQRALFVPLDPPLSRTNDFSLVVSTLDQLIWQLDAAMRATVRMNVPRPPIIEQGVMEPPLAVPARIEERNGNGLGGAVLIREGSTRVSHAHSILDVDARDLIVTYADDRDQARLIAELNAVALSSASRITPEQAGMVRVATMPVDLVVGVLADEGSDTTLGEAVAAKVAQDHLNHKKQWDTAAKDVHLGESCLIALHQEMLLSAERYEWLSGRLSAGHDEVDGSRVHEDDRWAELLWLFTTRKRPQSVVIRRPIAAVLEREEARSAIRNKTDRVPLAVALAMRSRRGAITDTAADRESKVLEGAVPALAWETRWAPTDTSVEDLVSTAIADAQSRNTSSAGVELAMRAIWYLAKHGQLKIPRNDLGAGADRRNPSELVLGMLASVRGVRQLGQAISDGRLGREAGMVLDDAGRVDVSGVGTPVALTDEIVRAQIVPKAGPPVPPPRDPREEFMDAIAAFSRQLNATVAADDQLRQIDDGHGRPMHEVEGVDPEQAADLVELIDSLRTHLRDYEVQWRVAEGLRRQNLSLDEQ